jgi:chromosome segregation ATPase
MIETSLEPLIAALREELKQYGEMLALLEQQQELVVRRAADDLFHSIARIQAQMAVLREARAAREERRRALARALGQLETAEFNQLVPLLPADYQPLVRALVTENNRLLQRVQQCAHQNHLLLSRSLELMQSFIGALLPVRDVPVYDGEGRRAAPAPSGPALLEAVG